MTDLVDPPLFREFPFNIGLRLLAPGDIRPTPHQRDSYQRFTEMGDPPADDLVAAFRRLPAGVGRAQFETALEQGIDAVDDPLPELSAFFAHVDARPYWVDQKKLDQAVRATSRIGAVASFTSLSMLSLMGGYLASRADKTLVSTGDLEAMAPRRLAETLAWTVDVTAPGALERFAIGFTSTMRVRLMHAMVRAGMSRRPDWDFTDWDQPVNQSTMAGTLMLFSLGNVVGSQALGVPFSRQDKEAIYHFWRYVGFLLGLDPELLPADEADTWRLLWLQADYEFRPDDDSRRLADALRKAVGPLLVGDSEHPLAQISRHVTTEFLCAYSRLILGEQNADALELPDNKLAQLMVAGFAATGFAIRYPLQRLPLPGLNWVRAAIGRRNIETFAKAAMAQHRGDRTYR
ncbi:MAG: oxygenase MpaB family protein, partial [Mycobacterium sp.]